MIIDFSNPDGSPNVDAAFLNMTLICALYEQDRSCFDTAAAQLGANVTYYNDDPLSYPPQIGVLTKGSDVLVVVSGSTTNAQLLGHVGGSVVPTIDPFVLCTNGALAQVNSSFYQGFSQRFQSVLDVIRAAGNGQVGFTGHSYGGAVAHIMSRTIANLPQSVQRNELMTFGQPRTYDIRPAVKEPDYYARVILAAFPELYLYENLWVDPVCTMPPVLAILQRFGVVAKFLQKWIGFVWGHHGDPWILTLNDFTIPTPFPLGLEIVPGVSAYQIGINFQAINLHYQWNYLKRIAEAWENS